MNRPLFLSLLGLGCIAAAGLGWTLGRGSQSDAPPTPPPAEPISALPRRAAVEVVGDYTQLSDASVTLRGDRDAAAISELVLGAGRTTTLGGSPEALGLIGELDLPEIADLLPQLLAKQPRPDALIAAALARWAETDAEAAITWALINLDSPGMTTVRPAILGAWAKHSPKAAIDWLNEQLANAPSQVRYRLESDFNTVINVWAQNDPAAALAAVVDQEQPGTYDKWWGLSQMASREDRRDELIGLVLAIGDEKQRQKGLESVLGAWSEDHPEGAAAWLDANGYTDSGLQWAVSQRYQLADPAANAEWILSRTEGEERESALTTAIAYWARADPESAGTWLEKSGESNDATLAQIATGWTSRDSDKALAWAMRVIDEGQRGAAIGGVLYEVEQDALREGKGDDFTLEPFAETTGMSAAELSDLLEKAGQRGSRF